MLKEIESQLSEVDPRTKRYSKEVKQKVVEGILSGSMLLEEAMEKYDVQSKRTVKAWLLKYMRKGKL